MCEVAQFDRQRAEGRFRSLGGLNVAIASATSRRSGLRIQRKLPAGQDAADGGVGLLRTPRHVPRYLTEPCQLVRWMAFPQIASVPNRRWWPKRPPRSSAPPA